MCGYCKHTTIYCRVADRLRHSTLRLSEFDGDIRRCLVALGARIRELKRLRSVAARQGDCTVELDCELRELRFSAMVLNRSVLDIRKQRKPWLNNGHGWCFEPRKVLTLS